MTGNITLALRAAQSGMAANQIALDAATNNITNSNSPNYSRKIAVFEQRVVNGSGAGVSISNIVRNVDEGLLKSLRNQYSGLKEVSVQSTYYSRMQDLFGTPADNSSISHILTKFTNTIESLVISPEKPLNQQEVVRWEEETTLKIQQIDKTIQDLRLEADVAIGQEVTKLNELVRRIQSQNEQIVHAQVIGGDSTTLKDNRDADLNALSEIIDIKYFTRKNGDVVVYSGAGKVLVDSVPVTVTHKTANNVSSLFSYDAGDFDGIWIGSTSNSANDLTGKLNSGSLKGLVDIRDNVLGGLQTQIEEMASQLRDVMNQEHNRGIPYPGMQTMSGTRSFADPASQTITLDPTSGSDDVAIILMDANGVQTASTTLETIMTDGGYGPAASPANGPWAVADVAATVEDWLQANGAASASAAIDSNGKFNINLNEPSLYMGFRDQVTSTAGSNHEDASIGFDSDGDTFIDKTIGGFSHFFGLNDFFVDGLPQNNFESKSLSSSYISPNATQTLSFRDSTGNLVKTPATTVSIPAGSSLQDMADNINLNVNNVTATVISDGSFSRLRIMHNNSETLVISQNVNGGDTILDDMEIDESPAQVASVLHVRDDILSSPGKIASGSVQWGASIGASGEYFSSVSDSSNISRIATRFSQVQSFNTAGGINSSTVTFESYTTTILSINANQADTNELRVEYQQNLTDSIQNQSDSVRGVNIDEEMSELLLLEQSYIAATRVISVIQKMLDALGTIV